MKFYCWVNWGYYLKIDAQQRAAECQEKGFQKTLFKFSKQITKTVNYPSHIWECEGKVSQEIERIIKRLGVQLKIPKLQPNFQRDVAFYSRSQRDEEQMQWRSWRSTNRLITTKPTGSVKVNVKFTFKILYIKLIAH